MWAGHIERMDGGRLPKILDRRIALRIWGYDCW